MRSTWLPAITEEPHYRLVFGDPYIIFANEAIAQNKAKAKGGDIGVVMGSTNLQGLQYDLQRQSREKAHDAFLIGWSWTGKGPQEPQTLPARKRNRRHGA